MSGTQGETDLYTFPISWRHEVTHIRLYNLCCKIFFSIKGNSFQWNHELMATPSVLQ